jgi:NRPS condensation-like uncharacterized protein
MISAETFAPKFTSAFVAVVAVAVVVVAQPILAAARKTVRSPYTQYSTSIEWPKRLSNSQKIQKS